MAAIFPNGLDSNICPSGTQKLNEVPHAELHCSESDQIVAVQTRVGVTGSTVPTTIDYELHNVDNGHDHDGVNSRPAALGPDQSGSLTYGSGCFALTADTRVGSFADQTNRTLLALKTSASLAATSSIAFESQDVELTPTAVRVNFSGSGVSGSVSGNDVTYVIPGHTHRHIQHVASIHGPFEFFVTGAMVHEFTYTFNIFVSTSIWYQDVSKTLRIFEEEILRNSKKQAITHFYRVYEVDGVTVKTTATDIITYAGAVETSRTRTIT